MNSSEIVNKFASRIARRPWPVLAVVAVVTAVSIWATLQTPILTSRKALLPKDADVAVRFERFLSKFGSAYDLIMVIEGAPRSELESFATELAESLRKQPEVKAAFERLDIHFFVEHAYLLIPPQQIDQLASFLKALDGLPLPKEASGWGQTLQILENWLKDPPPLSNMDVNLRTAEESLKLLDFLLEEWQRFLESPGLAPHISWDKLLAGHGAAAPIEGNGYFSSRDGRMLFMFVSPANPSEEFQIVAPFIESVRAEAQKLQTRRQQEGRPSPTVAFTGLPAVSYEEFKAIKHDIGLTVITAGILILLLILMVLKSLRWALLVFIPMGVGVLWSCAVTYLTVGHHTMITFGFTAILFGLGCDYGIFISSRIIEEQRKGMPLIDAITQGIAASYRAILACGGATVLVFASLCTVSFTGFAELGMVASTGVLLVLISTFVLLPAMFVLMPPKVAKPKPKPVVTTGAKFSPSRSTAALLLTLAAVGAGGGLVAAFSIPFDYDVLSLLPRDSEAARYQRRMVEESDYQGEVIIFTAKTMEEARRINDAASKLPSIARVQSLVHFFPPDAFLRVQKAFQVGHLLNRSDFAASILNVDRVTLSMATLDRLRSSVNNAVSFLEQAEEGAFSAGHQQLIQGFEKIRQRMESLVKKLQEGSEVVRLGTEAYFQALLNASQTGLRMLSSWKGAEELTPENLPDMLRGRFFAKDGTMAIYAFPALTVYKPQNLDRLISDVYTVSPEATGFPTTHQVFSQLVVRSFGEGVILAALVAFIWILLTLRSFSGFVIASLPLVVGGGLMMGVLKLAKFEFNYASMIALPLVVGLGLDYGVWYAHRVRELHDQSPWQVAAIAGKIIALAAGTTLTGLGAITLASYQGISTLGLSITIGLLCCLVAALVFSPAVAQFLLRRKP